MSKLVNKLDNGIDLSVSAPGKVILHGEHSVVYGKLAIAASLGLRSRLNLFEIQTPDTLVIEFLPLNFKHAFTITSLLQKPQVKDVSKFNLEHPELINFEEQCKIVEDVINKALEPSILNSSVLSSLKCIFLLISALVGSTNVDVKSLRIIVNSELKIGAGSGSSASFAVTTAAGLLQYIRLKTASIPQVSKPRYKEFTWRNDEINDTKKLSNRQLDIICKWAFFCERVFHGMPSGIDNTVCTYGSMVKFRKGESPELIKMTKSLKVLLINTGVSRVTSNLVSRVVHLKSKFPLLVDSILNTIDDLTQAAVEILRQIDSTDSEQHFEDLGVLVQMNHSLLAALGVSHPKLEEIMIILSKFGVKGKLTGAGGGGYAIAVLPPSFDAADIIKELAGGGFEVLETKLGGAGIIIY